MDPKPVSDIYSYHAHIYFDGPEQREAAMVVRAAIEERFSVQMGRVHDRLIGPHARPMYQVAFGSDQFSSFVPWLMLNRQSLAILIHPNTLNERRDHLVHPLWLGEILPILHEEQLTEIKEQEAVHPIIPNTTPNLTP